MRAPNSWWGSATASTGVGCRPPPPKGHAWSRAGLLVVNVNARGHGRGHGDLGQSGGGGDSGTLLVGAPRLSLGHGFS